MGSLPVRGAWIEIDGNPPLHYRTLSLPVRGAWIEIGRLPATAPDPGSLPVRGAWIEICTVIVKAFDRSGRSP